MMDPASVHNAGMPEYVAPQPERPVRTAADAYVSALADIDPFLTTKLGLKPDEDGIPDLSPAGQQAIDDLTRSALASIPEPTPGDGDERRCARLMRERLEAELAVSEAGEHLREVSNIFGRVPEIRGVLAMMPAATADDWAVIARRMRRIPLALEQYRESQAEGQRRGLNAAPRQVRTVIGQLDEWGAVRNGQGWFADFAARADVPPALRADLDEAAAGAGQAIAALRDWFATEYLPGCEGTPDGQGAERYVRGARLWNGATLDPREVYEWGLSQYREIRDEMKAEANRVLPGAAPLEAMRYLDEHSPAIEGVEEVREWLQGIMDQTIRDLDGTHFDLAEPLRRVEARIAPPGSAAAPYYTPPTQDFSRPGRTWLPTTGRTRFPQWNLYTVWYHEGVPGHHLQLAQWVYLARQLSTYQTSIGAVSASLEGWALYAERLMDELGYLKPPGARLGQLDAQMLRAMRVVVDTGMHLSLTIPSDLPVGAGQPWTAELAMAFFGQHSSMDAAFIESEIIRYLSRPGQAISYKLGERAWLAGRDAARAAHGSSFDLKAWHMAALSLGSLGLDDLTQELGSL